MSSDFNTYLGKFIKNLRVENKLSQEEFCKLLNNKISRSNLSKIELGKISTSADLIRDILLVFKISPYEILNVPYNKENDSVYIKYNELSKKDKLTINSMIEILLNNNSNLSSLMNIEKEKDNKVSS